MKEVYLKALETGFFELGEAFSGLQDKNVWVRPAPGLLSIGEIAGHIAFWLAVRLAGEGGENPPDVSKCKVKSVLIDHIFNYHSNTLELTPSEQHLAMTAKDIHEELLRVHQEAVGHFNSRNPDLESVPPGWPENYKYRFFLEYLGFHIAYHVGQIYTVRHLLGETTPDN